MRRGNRVIRQAWAFEKVEKIGVRYKVTGMRKYVGRCKLFQKPIVQNPTLMLLPQTSHLIPRTYTWAFKKVW